MVVVVSRGLNSLTKEAKSKGSLSIRVEPSLGHLCVECPKTAFVHVVDVLGAKNLP